MVTACVMAKSVFQNVENALSIEVFQLTKLFNECQSPIKINLGVGAFRDEEGKPWVLPVVRAAESQMANDRTLNHEYLPIAGLPDFNTAAIKLMLGSNHKAIVENKVDGFQAPGGTGALRLAATFLKNVLMFDIVYLSHPTWENHRGVFMSAGFRDIREYSYWDEETKDINFTGMWEDLLGASVNSIVILHAVAHNPTGVDLNQEQWQEICAVCKKKELFVLMDCAFQGFASGDLNSDAWVPRYFADQDMDLFIAQSFSKNFGLYNERVGNLIVVSRDEKKLPEIRSQMEVQIRTMWSNPPNHGARIVATVLNNKTYFEQWKCQILTMADRIKKMRHKLLDHLKKLGTPGNWEHITKQIGMFSYTGLTEKQVAYMMSKFIFLLRSGRISMAGLTSKNVAYIARIMDEAIRANPRNKKYFLEFAKHKLNQVEYNILKTSVVIDGVFLTESDEKLDDGPSVESFMKVELLGSLSSTSTIELELSQHTLGSEESIQQLQVDEHLAEEEQEMQQDVLSISTQPGTLRTSVKTFKTRSMQTLKTEEVQDLYQVKSVPARFEGTMLTPVYFDGLMLTTERLDNLLTDAAKKGDNSIPVKFQGGMLTAAFKTLAENLNIGIGTEPVNVKFHGRLKGLTNNEASGGIPVAFDGNMVPQVKSNKAKS